MTPNEQALAALEKIRRAFCLLPQKLQSEQYEAYLEIQSVLTAAQSAPVVDVDYGCGLMPDFLPPTGSGKPDCRKCKGKGWFMVDMDTADPCPCVAASGYLKTPSTPPVAIDLAELERARDNLSEVEEIQSAYEKSTPYEGPEKEDRDDVATSFVFDHKETIRALLDNAIAAQKGGV